jgi:hypothetical protein
LRRSYGYNVDITGGKSIYFGKMQAGHKTVASVVPKNKLVSNKHNAQ